MKPRFAKGPADGDHRCSRKETKPIGKLATERRRPSAAKHHDDRARPFRLTHLVAGGYCSYNDNPFFRPIGRGVVGRIASVGARLVKRVPVSIDRELKIAFCAHSALGLREMDRAGGAGDGRGGNGRSKFCFPKDWRCAEVENSPPRVANCCLR